MGGVGPGNGLLKIFTLLAVDGMAAYANRIARKPMADSRAIVGRWKRMETPREPRVASRGASGSVCYSRTVHGAYLTARETRLP